MTSDATLHDLLERVREGDSEAATTLVRQYEPELRRFIRYRLSDMRLRRFVDSVDVSQSVFARFFVCLAEGRIDLVHPQQLLASSVYDRDQPIARSCSCHTTG